MSEESGLEQNQVEVEMVLWICLKAEHHMHDEYLEIEENRVYNIKYSTSV